jgi:hypothetical protein
VGPDPAFRRAHPCGLGTFAGGGFSARRHRWTYRPALGFAGAASRLAARSDNSTPVDLVVELRGPVDPVLLMYGA